MVRDCDQAHVTVYQVLDDVLGGTAVPPGAKGTMYSIIDGLRSSAKPAEDIRRAERISITIHKLEIALRGRDERQVRDARDELKSLAVEWLDGRIAGQDQPARAPSTYQSTIFNLKWKSREALSCYGS